MKKNSICNITIDMSKYRSIMRGMRFSDMTFDAAGDLIVLKSL